MDLHVKRFDELETRELYEILRARVAVFVVEQECAYQDLDGLDQCAYHVWFTEDNQLVAYLRAVDAGALYPEVCIGRVLSCTRGGGVGRQLLAEGIRVAHDLMKASAIRVEAQSYAQGFYEKQGFKRVSDEFMLDGIPHVEMLRERLDAD